MNLIYPINFIGHDEWMQNEYSPNPASGDVVTRDGEVLGAWHVFADDQDGGRYEFIPDRKSEPLFVEEFASLDSPISRGLALSNITRAIREWHERS